MSDEEKPTENLMTGDLFSNNLTPEKAKELNKLLLLCTQNILLLKAKYPGEVAKNRYLEAKIIKAVMNSLQVQLDILSEKIYRSYSVESVLEHVKSTSIEYLNGVNTFESDLKQFRVSKGFLQKSIDSGNNLIDRCADGLEKDARVYVCQYCSNIFDEKLDECKYCKQYIFREIY